MSHIIWTTLVYMTFLPYFEHFSILYFIRENYRNIPLLSRSPLIQHHHQQNLFIEKKKKFSSKHSDFSRGMFRIVLRGNACKINEDFLVCIVRQCISSLLPGGKKRERHNKKERKNISEKQMRTIR